MSTLIVLNSSHFPSYVSSFPVLLCISVAYLKAGMLEVLDSNLVPSLTCLTKVSNFCVLKKVDVHLFLI
jgi:hypothetical protein